MSLLKFVILSDLHLGPPDVPVNGLDTGTRLAQAVEVISRDHADAAFVLLAGDLADRGEVAALRSIPMTTLAGSHYSVSPHVPGVPGRQRQLKGPAQMAVVLAVPDGGTVHFQDHCERHLTLAPGLFH